MKNVFAIAGKELRSSFVTPLAYVVMAGFVLLAGYFFFAMLNQFNTYVSQSALLGNLNPNLNEWVITPFYNTLQFVLIFALPILTMRSFAEERQLGTFELLATSPISVQQLVLGKFIGIATVVAIMLLMAFVFPAALIVVADPEVLPVFVGLIGLLLFAFAFVALGVAVSSFTKSQTLAAFVSLVVFVLFFLIDLSATNVEGPLAEGLKYLSPVTHAELFTKGVITGSGLVYFLSVLLFGLFVAARAIEAQRWR